MNNQRCPHCKKRNLIYIDHGDGTDHYECPACGYQMPENKKREELVLEDLLIGELQCVRLKLSQAICEIDKSVDRIERIRKLRIK